MTDFIKKTFRFYSIKRRHHEFKSQTPIPVSRWLEIRDEERQRYRDSEDLLSPIRFFGSENGYKGIHAELKPIFEGVELGTWALDSRTIDYFWKVLDEKKPKTILEFGSGSSTCAFAAWVKSRDVDCHIISIDQNQSEAEKTMSRLKGFGLVDCSKVLVMPQRTEDDRYDIDVMRIETEFGGKTIDMVFADGPAGRFGCRDSTLPSVIELLSKDAIWFLHDSLRDSELEIADKWATFKGVTCKGVIPFGNGLAVGSYTP